MPDQLLYDEKKLEAINQQYRVKQQMEELQIEKVNGVGY